MMGALVNPNPSTDNVIELIKIDGKLGKKLEIRYNKDGSIDRRYPHKKAGVSSRVYPFYEEDIRAMIEQFDDKIENAPNENRRWLAHRNKLIFVIGINLSLRVSDLVKVRWNFFLKNDGSFKNYYELQPKKTRRYKKFVKVYFNESVKKAIANYISEYPIEDMNDYVFKSRKGDGCLTEIGLGNIIKTAAQEVGIEQNINSHSLRQSFGYHVWHNAEDKEKALILLMTIFNHSSIAITKRYIGIMDDEIEDVFNGLNLGLDLLD